MVVCLTVFVLLLLSFSAVFVFCFFVRFLSFIQSRSVVIGENKLSSVNNQSIKLSSVSCSIVSEPKTRSSDVFSA